MSYHYNPKTGQIIDGEDGQVIATMSESATPEQAKILAASSVLLAVLVDVKNRLEQCAATTASAADAYDTFFQIEINNAIAQAKGAARLHSAQRTPAATAKKSQYKCASCGDLFTARVADRKRGWARYCSKSCKAIKQEARTGQYGRYLQGESGGLCHPSMAEDDIQP